MTDIERSRQITRYIKGELELNEVDQLWIEFLKNPDLFKDFMIEVHIFIIIHSQKQPFRERKKQGSE